MPDGSVSGEGTVQVNGRVVTGTTDDLDNPFVFAPRVARCAVGRLIAGASAPKIPITTATATPASPPTTDAAPRAPAASGNSLSIASGPGVSSLLAGKALLVLRENLEDVLANVGIKAPSGSTRVSTWAHACEQAPREAMCQQGVIGLSGFAVARAIVDAKGTAVFNNIPSSGTFYVVIDTSLTRHLIWNVKVDLKPGANSITLDERNTTPLDR